VCPEAGQKDPRKIKGSQFLADKSHKASRSQNGNCPHSRNSRAAGRENAAGEFPPPEVFDIEGSARPGDGEGQRGGRKASGAEENDGDDLMLDAETESGGTLQEDSARNVDYFA
jgi:hypothetical protein